MGYTREIRWSYLYDEKNPLNAAVLLENFLYRSNTTVSQGCNQGELKLQKGKNKDKKELFSFPLLLLQCLEHKKGRDKCQKTWTFFFRLIRK